MRPISIRLLLAVALTAGAGLVLAAEKPESLIPFDKLDAATQARVRQVVPGHTFYRKVRLPKPTVHARYDVFEYLINHLDQCSVAAQLLKIVIYRSERRPDGSYFADDRKGAAGYLWPLLDTAGERLYFAQGVDKRGERVSGSAVILFRYREKQPGVIECELHGFVKVDSWMQRICALLFLPFITSTVDQRFGEVVNVPVQVSETATADPAKMLKLLDTLSPEDAAMMKEFRALVAKPEAKP
ncbi:MAG: hypothetical protein A2107_07175 [Verrucomicrobia bacterium GWF2_62_7]|nr:MAG: hypothetical protein A2107_07175 [Verrucomicrobia bacterium GWF2_62_7]